MIMTEQITIDEVLTIIEDCVEWCRRNNQTDLRNVLITIRGVKSMIEDGKSAEEIIYLWGQ
jgi:hypothetical protein